MHTTAQQYFRKKDYRLRGRDRLANILEMASVYPSQFKMQSLLNAVEYLLGGVDLKIVEAV